MNFPANAEEPVPDEAVEVLIIGWGIQGRNAAIKLLEGGYQVTAIAPADEETGPCADSQRMYSILQSGILLLNHPWADQQRGVKGILQVGRSLLERFGVPIPDYRAKPGILQLPKGHTANFVETAQRNLAIYLGDDLIAPLEAEQLLGPAYMSTADQLRIPDVPFDAGELLTRLDLTAHRFAGFERITGVAQVHWADDSHTHLRVTSEGRSFLPGVTLLCAGTGTLALLNQLDRPRDLHIRAKCIFRTRCPADLTAPFVIDRSEPGTRRYLMRYPDPTGGAHHLAIGVEPYETRESDQWNSWASITKKHEATALSHLSRPLRDLIGDNYHVTAAHEIWLTREAGSVRKALLIAQRFEMLSARAAYLLPGRAVLAGSDLRKLVGYVRAALGPRMPCEPRAEPVGGLVRTCMHFDFPNLDDRTGGGVEAWIDETATGMSPSSTGSVEWGPRLAS